MVTGASFASGQAKHARGVTYTMVHPPGALRPVLSLPRLVALTFAVIAPSASVFLTYGSAYAEAGTGIVIGYAIAAGLNLITMLAYAEVGSAYPRAGGDYSLAASVLGRKAANFYTVFFAFKGMVIPALLSLTAASYIHMLFPHLAVSVLGVLCLALFIGVAFLAITTSSRVVTAMVAIEATVYVGFMVTSLVFAHQPLAILWHPVINLGQGHVGVSWSRIWPATTTALYGYNGAQACLYYSEETVAEPKAFGKTILWATLITVLVEFMGVVATTLALPHLGPDGHGAIPLIALFRRSVWGRRLTPVLIAGVSIALIDTGIATTMGYGRIYYTIARDQQWPEAINRICLRMNARGVPVGALVVLAGVNAGMILMSGVSYLIIFTGSLLLLIYLGIQFSALAIRFKGPAPPYRMPGWPLFPVLASLALIFLITRLGRSQLISVGVILLIGLIFAATDRSDHQAFPNP